MQRFRFLVLLGFSLSLALFSACTAAQAPDAELTSSAEGESSPADAGDTVAVDPAPTFHRLHPDGPPGEGLKPINDNEIEHIYHQSDKHELISAGVWEAKPYTSGPDTPNYSEFMYIISGSITLEDGAGNEASFGPGDALLIPRGTTHHWKQSEPLRKYWAIFDVGEVGPASEAKSWIQFDPNVPLSGEGRTREHQYFDANEETISAGVWEADPKQTASQTDEPPKFRTTTYTELMCILEGSVTLADPTGREELFRAGDVVIVPRGAKYQWKQTEYVKKYWVIFDAEADGEIGTGSTAAGN